MHKERGFQSEPSKTDERHQHANHKYLDAFNNLIHRNTRQRELNADLPDFSDLRIGYSKVVAFEDHHDEEQEDLEAIEEWHRIVREVAALHKERESFEAMHEHAEVERALHEAHEMMILIDEIYGWEPGEPHVVDRMFGANVRALLVNAMKTGVVDFKMVKMINTMKAVVHAEGIGEERLAKVAAVRNLVGGVTVNEAELLIDEKRLKAEHFAELVGYADKLSRAEEKASSLHVGHHATTVELHTPNDMLSRSLADDLHLRRN